MTPNAERAAVDEARYEMRAGLRLCVRLATETKAFCSCAQSPAAEPNANVCAVCLGLPGTLPALNAKAVELGARAALALCCTVNVVTTFARAHGASPTLPKGYRVAQHPRPFAAGGYVEIGVTEAGAPITVPVERVTLTESGAALGGERGGASDDRAYGLDVSAAGAAVVEIEVGAELRSAEEAAALVRQIQATLRFAGASRASLVDGTLSLVASLGVRPRGDTGAPVLGELAHLPSVAALTAALRAEFSRQVAILAAGGEAVRSRHVWDAAAGALRPAGRADPDRRWLADPDLPPLVLTSEWIAARRDGLPEPPSVRRARLAGDHALSGAEVDALAADPALAAYFESVARASGDSAVAARWVLDEVVPLLDAEDPDVEAFALRVRPADLAELLVLVRDVRLTEAAARQTFALMARTGLPPERAAKREELLS